MDQTEIISLDINYYEMFGLVGYFGYHIWKEYNTKNNIIISDNTVINLKKTIKEYLQPVNANFLIDNINIKTKNYHMSELIPMLYRLYTVYQKE